MEGFEAVELAGSKGQTDSGFFGRNDLQAVTERLFPRVREASALMTSLFGNARMSGSGSAVFSRCGFQVGSAGPTFPDLPKAWALRACQSLAVHPLREWATG
jgi:4-diphosphocytidyl-2-C-methyl-D-erythritol kinase